MFGNTAFSRAGGYQGCQGTKIAKHKARCRAGGHINPPYGKIKAKQGKPWAVWAGLFYGRRPTITTVSIKIR